MKFDNQALLSLAALCSFTFNADAFVFQARKNSGVALFDTRMGPRVTQAMATRLFVSDDDDDEEEEREDPLGKGVDSVSWLPSVVGASNEDVSSVKEGAAILPLFPLGGFVYTPNTEHVLNIFEPRYREMYTDILMNGSKRFVVATSHPTEEGRFAQTGVLFELEDLKEVSEQTEDQIKYICSHKVTGRVTINRVLNPEVWENRETYLKVEGVILDDSGKKDEDKQTPSSDNDVYGAIASAASVKEEGELRDAFEGLVDMQHELEEDVRFTKAAKESLAAKDGPGEDGLWQTVRLWQSFVDQRLMARQNELQSDFQEKLQKYLKKDKGLETDELPSAIGFQDLTPELQQELQDLQKRMAVELKPLVLESSLTMQKILEAPGHRARCKLLNHFMDAETKRLKSKKSLMAMFSGNTATVTQDIPREEMITDDSESLKPEPKSSAFFDEEDAFQ